jgi:hypothetical protein
MLPGVGQAIARAVVVEIADDGVTIVETADASQRLMCDFLLTGSDIDLPLRIGQPVLAYIPSDPRERGVILGKIGLYEPLEPAESPDTRQIVIEADEELVLRCGEASVTLNHTGRILIKAVDVVSRAKRTQRIKGGSVHIN